ncbi:MAG: PAS domain S-box protein, partial [Methanoregula sp.]
SISAYCTGKDRFATIFEDITKRKRAEDALRESEAKFRGMAERISDIVLLVDKDFLLTYVSPSLLAMMERTAPDLLGKALPINNFPPSEQEKIHAAFLENRALRTTGPLEITFPLPDGRSRILEFHGIPFWDRGVFQGVQLVAHDITDLRRAQDELRSAYEQLAASDEELRQNYEELRKNEQMLRASEEKFRALVEYSLDGILITDVTGILLFANRAAGAMVDVPDPEAASGKTNVLEFADPDYRDAMLRDFEKIKQGTDAYLVNYKLVTTTGRKIWVECIGKKIPFQDKEAVLVSMRDVTERKNSEERVRESENRFATVFRSSPVALTLVSAADGVFVDVNDTFARNTGYIRDQVIGKTSEQIGLISDAEDREKMISAFRNRQDIQGMEITCRNKAGEIRACLFSSRHILMQEKPYILSTILDISDRKTAEVALRESEQKFRRIADNAPDMIYRISVPDGKFEYVSPASIALTGYTPEEFHADPGLVRTLIHPAWKEYFRIQWAALPEKKVLPAYEYQIIDRAGEIHWLNQRNMPVTDETGNLVAIEGIVTDITRQKNTERELRRNELRSLAVSENSGSWIWEIDPDGIYRYSSPAVVQILGYRADELVGKMHFYDLLDPSMKADLTKAVFATMEGREPFRNFTNLNRHKNGTPVLIRTSGSPVFDEDGTFIGYCGVDEDITERTARESSFQALVRSMVGTTGINALRQIAENISSWLGTDGVMIGEIQPDKQTVNVTYMLLDGKEVAGFTYTLQGTPCENVTEKGFCLYQDNVRELFPESRDLAEFNIRGYIGTPLRNSAGQVFGILCAVSKNPIIPAPTMQETMDIIAVKAVAEIESMQMERALRESEQKFRSLVEYALEGIFVLELEGTILFANDAAVRTLGFESPAELTGRNVMEFVAPESQQDAIKDFGEVARGHDAYLAQYKVITVHGKTIFIDSIGKVINYEGKTADLVSIRDVTDRKRAEDALSRSQHMLAEAMDMAHLVNWEFDIASELFTFDDRFYALYGTTAEREGGNLMPWEVYTREFLHPDDMHKMDEEVKREITATDPNYLSRIEHRIIRRDGEVRHMVVRIGLIKDAEGRTIKTHGANQDITEIRMAEEAVRESEVKYRLLAENVHDVIWTATMDMHLTYISPSVMALRGFTVEEAMAESITDAVTPSSLEVLMRGRETGLQCLKRDEILPNSTMELEFYRKDGSTVWTETIISLAFDSSRRPVGVVGVIRDITQRRQVENALRESEERYRSLVETSPGMIWEIDLQGKFRYISPMMKTTMGYEPKEMEGKSITDLIPEEGRALVMQKLARHVTSGGPIPPFEVPARHRDGHEMVVEIRPTRVLDTGGILVGLRGVANDVTERKKAEEALTRANRQLTLLGSVTRHDLLNKITVILGYLKIVEKKSTDPELADYLNKMKIATAAIKSQIEFTRVYQNLGTHEPQWIDLETIMPYPYVPSKILIHADLRGIRVRADPMLEKVFFNLLDNSLRHGKQVTKIGVSSHPSGRDLVIVWEDNGVGIPADIKEQIFEHGFGENTGLGMFLAREILALTGITITETGEPGKGARFEIVVPGGAYRIISPP